MRRPWLPFQIVLGWLPVWALYTALIVFEHAPTSVAHAALLALQSIVPAALLGIVVYRFTRRLPWPRPFRASFIMVHLAAALAYGAVWIASASVVSSIIERQLVIVVGPGVVPFLVLGVWLYVIVAGVSYASDATERAARAEAEAARAQLQALRAQLHPHFVFNALHTVVQLIPVDPARAAQAAEEVAHLLRATVEGDRDIVRLRDEWGFVERYVSLEKLRLEDRLRLEVDISPAAADAELPSFALQTLVENAIRHGVAPRAEPTAVTVHAACANGMLTIVVADSGSGAATDALENGAGSGLRRLRARLRALYGNAASLRVEGGPGGVRAELVVPQDAGA